ncbi:MAG: hypothetical protein GY720_02835, partial [bacterium]|nr:hypothetical protein [bacterium]
MSNWVALVAALFGFLLCAGIWWIWYLGVRRRVDVLTREVARFANAPAAADPRFHEVEGLGGLPDAVTHLAEILGRTRRETTASMAAARANAEATVARLEAVLRDLSEGVIVCDMDHRVLLYNRSALWFVDSPDKLTLGANLYDIVEKDEAAEAYTNLIGLDAASGKDINPHT